MAANKNEMQQIRLLVRAAIKVALRCGMSKWRLAEMISDEYDVERDNQRRAPP